LYICKLMWNLFFLSYATWDYCRKKALDKNHTSNSIEVMAGTELTILFFLSILHGAGRTSIASGVYFFACGLVVSFFSYAFVELNRVIVKKIYEIE